MLWDVTVCSHEAFTPRKSGEQTKGCGACREGCLVQRKCADSGGTAVHTNAAAQPEESVESEGLCSGPGQAAPRGESGVLL